jgi:hypothetical protein
MSFQSAVALVCATAAIAGTPAFGAGMKADARAERERLMQEQEARLAKLEAALAASAASSSALAARLAQVQQQAAQLSEALEKERTERKAEEAAQASALSAESLRAAATYSALPPALATRRPGVTLGGYLQADYNTRSDQADEIDFSSGEPLNQTRFVLRRARLRADLDFGAILGALELDANTLRGPALRVVGAEASWRLLPEPGEPPLLMLTAGLFKTPFGYEIIQSDRDRLFVERSTAERGLFPGEYDLGVRAQGGWRFLRYAAAVMNGHPIGEKGQPGRAPTMAKDLVGRIGVEAQAGRVAVHGGFSALYGKGFHKGTAATKDTLVWRDYNEDNIVQLSELLMIPGQPATPSALFPHSALGLDLRVDVPLAFGNLNLAGEVYWARNLDRAVVVGDPIGAGRDVREYGWYAAAVQDFGERFQLGVRYDRYQPDRDATETLGGSLVPRDPTFGTLSVSAAVRARGLGRVVVQYDRNWNALGRNLDGSPTTLGANAVTARAQVEF